MSFNVCIEMPYTPAPDMWVPTFLNSEILLEIWSRDALARDVGEYVGEPQRSWFKRFQNVDQAFLCLGKASVSDEAISFENGRHRTRWMLDNKVLEVPVCLTHTSYYNALMMGLISRRAFIGDQIEGIRLSCLIWSELWPQPN